MQFRTLTSAQKTVQEEIEAGTPPIINLLAFRTGLSLVTVREALRTLGIKAISYKQACMELL